MVRKNRASIGVTKQTRDRIMVAKYDAGEKSVDSLLNHLMDLNLEK